MRDNFKRETLREALRETLKEALRKTLREEVESVCHISFFFDFLILFFKGEHCLTVTAGANEEIHPRKGAEIY